MSASPTTAGPAEGGGPGAAPSPLVWFFGYGSLMWRPGFVHDAFEVAELRGWHRSLCIYSHHYRGTTARPGLVLGLAPGGSCTGRAFGVERVRETEVVTYLDERELLTDYVYERRRLPVGLPRTGETVGAWCYVAKPLHPQYAGGLDEAAVAAIVRQGRGSAGSCEDYVRNTVAHLREMGIAEPALEGLLDRLDAEPG